MNQSFKNRKHNDNRHNIMIAVCVLLLAGFITIVVDV